MITQIHPNVIHILNSKIMNWLFPKICSDLGSGVRYFKQFVEFLPIPTISNNRDLYTNLTLDNVDEVLSKFYNLDTQENQIINQKNQL